MDEDSNAESLKVVLLGESGVGKTSIISQLMEQEFNDEQTATTGATFSTKTMVFDNKGICFEIWDTAGQEKYRALTKMFYKDAGAAILVYDITRQASFEELKNYWANQVKENAPKKIVLAVAANKSDLIDTDGRIPAFILLCQSGIYSEVSEKMQEVSGNKIKSNRTEDKRK